MTMLFQKGQGIQGNYYDIESGARASQGGIIVQRRVDRYTANTLDPDTGEPYDDSWTVFSLTDGDYRMRVGGENGRAYVLDIGKYHLNWKMALGDFIDYHGAAGHKIVLALGRKELDDALDCYRGHSCRDRVLRDHEPPVMIHSTTPECYERIVRDGCLKSWNRLAQEGFFAGEEPIGRLLGDPAELRDYILFGSGVTGEIVVSSREKRRIEMDWDRPYEPGARFYFDMRRIAADGLLIRDGSEMKVKDVLPLEPYLIWTATAEGLDLGRGPATPRRFAEKADLYFREHYRPDFRFEAYMGT